MLIQTLAVNRVGNYRKATLNGRTHYVVPVAMIAPGVLNGSRGALYYPPEEIRKNFDAWNGMPLVVTHPVVNGKPVSARTPSQLEKSVGVVLNAKINHHGKLMAEAWFDVDKTREVDARIISRIERGEQIELSTGLFTDNIPVSNEEEAVYNGKKYTHVAKNYRPDHLAILPDETGACSLKDGCGVGVTNKASEKKSRCWKGYKPVKGKKTYTEDSCEPVGNSGLISNVLAYSEIYAPLEQAIRKQFDGAYSHEIYPDFVVFRWMNALYKIGYKVTKDDEVVLTSEIPEKVRKVVTYKPVVTLNQLSRLVIDAFNHNKCGCDECSKGKSCPCKKKKLRKVTGVKYAGAPGPVDYKTSISTNTDPLEGLSNVTKAQLIINVFSDEARKAALEARRHGGKALKAAGKAVGAGVKHAAKRVGKAYKEAAIGLIAKIKARLGLGMKKGKKIVRGPSKRQQIREQQEKTRPQRVEQRQKQLQERLAKARQERAAKDAKKKAAQVKAKAQPKSKSSSRSKGGSNAVSVSRSKPMAKSIPKSKTKARPSKS